MGDYSLLYNGFVTVFSLQYLLACFIGVFIGTMIGVLPGIGPTATMTLMLPFTSMFDPAVGLITLTGVLCGAMYGGSTTSILVNIPGEAASVVTCIDGYQMTRKGRGGAALAVVAVGSFIAGTAGIFGLQIFGPLLGNVALSFGPPEFSGFMALAFVLLSTFSSGSIPKSFTMLGFGLWLSTIGLCALDTITRFTLGYSQLMMGIEFVPIAVGLFGLTEILVIASQEYVPRIVSKVRLRELYPTDKEIRRSVAPIARGTVLGFFTGLLPGPSAAVATFLSYALEKKLSKNPQEFGSGAIEGVSGPETANNSAAIASFIPLLTLGIPFSPTSAVLLAGLILHNVEPGPLLFQNNSQIFWTLIAGLYVGNIMLLILNLPFVGYFAKVATIKPPLLMPVISMICIMGVYAVRNSFFDIWVMLISGIVGVVLRKYKYPVAPLIIGLILGPITEYSFRQMLMMFRGDMLLILERPIAVTFFLMALGVLLFSVFGRTIRRRIAARAAEP